jgi:hypothetical protein
MADTPIWDFDTCKELQAEVDRLRSELATEQAWHKAVSGAIKCAPWFEKGEWAGDKEGWGYHLEMVGYLIREGERLRKALRDVIFDLHNCRYGGDMPRCDHITDALKVARAAKPYDHPAPPEQG